MAGLGPLIKPILRDTFIEVLVDELNKLEHKNDDKIKDIDEIDNKYLNLEENQAQTNQNSLKHLVTRNNCAVI